MTRRRAILTRLIPLVILAVAMTALSWSLSEHGPNGLSLILALTTGVSLAVFVNNA